VQRRKNYPQTGRFVPAVPPLNAAGLSQRDNRTAAHMHRAAGSAST
jgi:hypothetical protein